MMDSEERKRFWDTLCTLRNRSSESIDALCATIKAPNRFCRFRSVSESSLLDLQGNVLRFSSADYYDDPFDTYFRLNHEALNEAITQFNRLSFSDNGAGIQEIVLSWPVPTEEKNAVLQLFEYFRQAEVPLQVPNSKLEDIDHLREDVIRKLYTICFCEDPFSETSWLKYGNRHKGFVQIYENSDSDALLCGSMDKCIGCIFVNQHPALYPIYYSDDGYDATRYALGLLALKSIPSSMRGRLPILEGAIADSLCWEIERISLIKKKCHEYDSEWRMVCPFWPPERPAIGMKPSAIALGLRMPEYEKRLVISAAEVAGIELIYELYIDDKDELAMRVFRE